MARPLNKLSDLRLKSAKATGRYSDGGGLYLSVSKSGTRSWTFMWVNRGRRREMGLGSYPAVTLASARQKAALCREQIAAGYDPITERDRAPAPSFGECARRYIAAKTPEWTNQKHKYQWNQTLMGCPTVVLDKPVSEITGEDILSVLRPIWLAKSETASRLRGRIEKVLDFAKSEGWRTGENPAIWKGNLENKLPRRRKLSRGHHPAMPFEDVPGFLMELQQREAVAARALEFTILTSGRSGEVLGATWTEIDLDRAIWTVPAARMKGGAPHEVPLSAQAIKLLRAMQANSISRYVFP